jgi:hypothetical protein
MVEGDGIIIFNSALIISVSAFTDVNTCTSSTVVGPLTNLSRHWSVLGVETANSSKRKKVEREDEKVS